MARRSKSLAARRGDPLAGAVRDVPDQSSLGRNIRLVPNGPNWANPADNMATSDKIKYKKRGNGEHIYYQAFYLGLHIGDIFESLWLSNRGVWYAESGDNITKHDKRSSAGDALLIRAKAAQARMTAEQRDPNPDAST